MQFKFSTNYVGLKNNNRYCRNKDFEYFLYKCFVFVRNFKISERFYFLLRWLRRRNPLRLHQKEFSLGSCPKIKFKKYVLHKLLIWVKKNNSKTIKRHNAKPTNINYFSIFYSMRFFCCSYYTDSLSSI